MGLDDLLHDIQPEPEPFGACAASHTGLEWFEQARHQISGDVTTVVHHCDHFRVAAGEGDRDGHGD